MRVTMHMVLVPGETDTLWVDVKGIPILKKTWHS
jgi:hypothetical protein